MRAALVRGAAVLAAISIAAAACGSSDPAGPSPPPSAAASPSASSPPPASPSPGGVEAQVEFCSHLNAFATAAGPTLDIGALALIDGESANERGDVSQLVDSIALHGVLLKPDLPADLADDMDSVVAAAAEAKRKLAAGGSAADAVALLQTPKVKAARDALVKHRGSC